MLRPIGRTVLGILALLALAPAQTSRPPLTGGVSVTQDFCSSSAACETPARGPQCPQVRFGWGNCPGSKQACDWCYGANGVFAYSPRGSQYTLSSGCSQFGSNTTWSTKDPQVAQWMGSAGGNCTADGRGGTTCSNVDATQFKQAASCGTSATQPPPASPPQSASTGDCSCYTPARGSQCPQVRFGWGDCPGSKQACDYCYGPNGVFAYAPRGSQYTLATACSQLGSNATWSTQDSQVAQSMSNAGGNCTPDQKGGYSCTNVDPAKYQQTASCGSQPPPSQGPCPVNSSNSGAAASSLAGRTSGGTGSLYQSSNCQTILFTYFYINGINTPMTSADWRGNYESEYGTVGVNLVDDKYVKAPRSPFVMSKTKNPATIAVAGEIDQMYAPTHNPSGKDPWNDDWAKNNCQPNNKTLLTAPLCGVLDNINALRAGSRTRGFSVGDLYECMRQSIQLPLGASLPGGDFDSTLVNDATATQVITAIVQAYSRQSSQTQNYFIIVAHSQGNFFAESIAKYIKENHREIFDKHLGIVSLASPTNYASLQDSAFLQTKIVHHTRADDAINVVATIGGLAANIGVTGKKPWTSNDPPLWPWPSSGGFDFKLGVLTSSSPQPRPDLFTADQLIYCDPAKGLLGCTTGRFFNRLGYDSGVNPNPELYSPLLNSHLLENYLIDPPATVPGKSLKWNPALVSWKLSPRTVPVLNCVRRDLVMLKQNLMNSQTARLDTSTCTGN